MSALAEVVAPAAARKGPYNFLDYFADTEEDRRRFSGRDTEVRELTALIASRRTVVLYGRSGIGKTSLLLAGVFPELRRRGYRPLYLRTLTSPLQDLLQALAGASGAAGPGQAPAGEPVELARRAAAAGPLALVFDQFEELFVRFRGQPEQQRPLLAALARLLADTEGDVTVVFSLREDYLAELEGFPDLLPDLLTSRYRLRGLSAFGVRQAVCRPLIEAGIAYDEALISRIVDSFESYDPAMVQILCTELYLEAERREGGLPRRLVSADLEAIGGSIEGIFRRYLDGVEEALPVGERFLARLVLDALITRENTKRATTLTNLLQLSFTAQPEEVAPILDRFRRHRLLRREQRDGETWYELIHERLVGVARDWLGRDYQFFDFQQARSFVEINSEGDLWRGNPELLLNAGILRELLGPYRERFLFDRRQLELVVRSAVEHRDPALGFWAGRYGTRESIDLLTVLARDGSPRVRELAAAAAGEVQDEAGRLARICLDLALADDSPEVRRAAGRSLAPLASWQEIRELQAALRQRGTRGRALEALANLRAGGHRLEGFSLLRRLAARRRARRQTLREKIDVLRDRRKEGAIQGLQAGVVWALTVGPLLGASFGWADTYPKPPGLTDTLLFAGYLLLPCLGIGALLGWIAGAAAAKHAALHGEGRWFAALAGSGWLFLAVALPLGLVSLGVLIVLSLRADFPSRIDASTKLAMLLALCSPWLTPVLLAALVRLHRSCVWPGLPRLRQIFWVQVSALGMPVLLLLGLFRLASLLGASIGDPKGCGIALAMIPSLALAVLLQALAGAAEKHPLGPPPSVPPGRRRRARLAALAAALLTLAWVCLLPVVAARDKSAPAPAQERRTQSPRSVRGAPLRKKVLTRSPR